MTPKYVGNPFPPSRLDGFGSFGSGYGGSTNYMPNYVQNNAYGEYSQMSRMSKRGLPITDFSQYQPDLHEQVPPSSYPSVPAYPHDYYDPRTYSSDPRMYDPTQPQPLPYAAPDAAAYPPSGMYYKEPAPLPMQSSYSYNYSAPYSPLVPMSSSTGTSASSIGLGMNPGMGAAGAPKSYSYQTADSRNPYFGISTSERTASLTMEPRTSAAPSATPSLTIEADGKEHKMDNYNSDAFPKALGFNFQDQAKDGDAEDYGSNGTCLCSPVGYPGGLESEDKPL